MTTLDRTQLKSFLKDIEPSHLFPYVSWLQRALHDRTWSKVLNTVTMSELRALYQAHCEYEASLVLATPAVTATSASVSTSSITLQEEPAMTTVNTADMNVPVSEVANAVLPQSEEIQLNKDLVPTLDTLLATVTGGKIKNIASVVQAMRTMKEANEKMEFVVRDMEGKLKMAIAKAASAPVIQASVPASSDGALPSGKTKQVTAMDIFVSPSGKKSTSLGFEVPFMEWDTPHPMVPVIDPNYIFKVEHLVQFLFGMVTGKNAWLHGHTGTGKTTFVEQVCARLGWPVMRVNMDNDIERSDFLGSTQLQQEEGTTVSKFVEGVLPRAMQMPCVLLIDECDFGKSGIMYVLQRALEAKGLLLTEDGGRLIVPNPMFRIVATANTRGQGDEMGCYPGARVQSNALLDRFTVWMHIDYMSEREEKKLLSDTFPLMSGTLIDQLTLFAREIRKAFLNRELLTSISPRSLLTIGEATRFYAMVMPEGDAIKMAIKSSFLERATDDTRAKVEEISNRIFASSTAKK